MPTFATVQPWPGPSRAARRSTTWLPTRSSGPSGAASFVWTLDLTSPSVDITVTSNDGKRVEKVLLSKSGDKYVARRENEPSLYELESKTVDDLEKAAGDVKPAAPAKK